MILWSMYTVFGVLCSVCDTCHFQSLFVEEDFACWLHKRAQTNGLVPENWSCAAFFLFSSKKQKSYRLLKISMCFRDSAPPHKAPPWMHAWSHVSHFEGTSFRRIHLRSRIFNIFYFFQKQSLSFFMKLNMLFRAN